MYLPIDIYIYIYICVCVCVCVCVSGGARSGRVFVYVNIKNDVGRVALFLDLRM